MKQTIIDKRLVPTETDFLNTVVMPLINEVCKGGYVDAVTQVKRISEYYENIVDEFYHSYYNNNDTYLLVLCKSDKSIHIRHDDWEIVKRETINQ